MIKKELLAIVMKPMCNISSRTQRMILKLLNYHFEINYVPGNQIFLADTLSMVTDNIITITVCIITLNF